MARNGNELKTHCLRGHEFTEANTYRPKQGGRVCRQCHRERLHGLTSDRHLERPQLDDKAVRRLADAFNDGVSRQDLAGRFGITSDDVNFYLRRRGVAA